MDVEDNAHAKLLAGSTFKCSLPHTMLSSCPHQHPRQRRAARASHSRRPRKVDLEWTPGLVRAVGCHCNFWLASHSSLVTSWPALEASVSGLLIPTVTVPTVPTESTWHCLQRSSFSRYQLLWKNSCPPRESRSRASEPQKNPRPDVALL